MKVQNGKKVCFEGTKSHGDDWGKFIGDSHFKGKTKKDIYGIVFSIIDQDIWIHIYDKKTGKLLDQSTWVFFKKDLMECSKIVCSYKRGDPMKCNVCKHNLVYSEEDKMFFCPNCGQKYD